VEHLEKGGGLHKGKKKEEWTQVFVGGKHKMIVKRESGGRYWFPKKKI